MSARAFAPAHISGFFLPRITGKHETSGSLGAGICLSEGITAEAEIADTPGISFNNKPFYCKPVEEALLSLTEKPLKITLTSTLPLGAGFGLSGACTLAALIAANQVLDRHLLLGEIAKLAHTSEVRNRTGLGDVAAQSTGGVVIRLRPGMPPATERIPAGTLPVSWAYFKGISTEDVLEDAALQRQIVKSGREALKNLLQKPTLENLMIQSKRFTEQAGLASSQVLDAIEAAEAKRIPAAQAMLGDTVFALGEKVFCEYRYSGTGLINHTGAILL